MTAAAKLKRIRERLPDAVRGAVGDAAEQACGLARSAAPVDTGRLRDSIAVRRTGDGASVTAQCPYAAAVEFGSAGAAARPFMACAAQTVRGAFVKGARAAAEKALR